MFHCCTLQNELSCRFHSKSSRDREKAHHGRDEESLATTRAFTRGTFRAGEVVCRLQMVQVRISAFACVRVYSFDTPHSASPVPVCGTKYLTTSDRTLDMALSSDA